MYDPSILIIDDEATLARFEQELEQLQKRTWTLSMSEVGRMLDLENAIKAYEAKKALHSSGQGLAEYALILALIAVLTIVAILFGKDLNGILTGDNSRSIFQPIVDWMNRW